MIKDKLYYTYVRMLIEQRQSLMETEDWWTDDDRNIQTANLMAHNGMPIHDIHQHLVQTLGNSYHVNPVLDWYKFGNSPPPVQYLRKAVKLGFDSNNQTQTPEIEGVPIHDHIIHPGTIHFLHSVHKFTKDGLGDHRNLTIYRGMHVPKEHVLYHPHSLESWSDSKTEAEKFMHIGTKNGHVPVLYKATIPTSEILMSHMFPTPFRPPESSLVGKQEQTVFGHALHHIERIK